jgi:hypothetical protein
MPALLAPVEPRRCPEAGDGVVTMEGTYPDYAPVTPTLPGPRFLSGLRSRSQSPDAKVCRSSRVSRGIAAHASSAARSPAPRKASAPAVMELYPVGERFFQEFTLRQVLLNAAKNGSGPSAAGISSRAERPNTARPAATTISPAPEASPAPTNGSVPIASTH